MDSREAEERYNDRFDFNKTKSKPLNPTLKDLKRMINYLNRQERKELIGYMKTRGVEDGT